MVFTNYSKSQKFEDKSCLLVFEESSIGTLEVSKHIMKFQYLCRPTTLKQVETCSDDVNIAIPVEKVVNCFF